jgi:hypothetical protein
MKPNETATSLSAMSIHTLIENINARNYAMLQPGNFSYGEFTVHFAGTAEMLTALKAREPDMDVSTKYKKDREMQLFFDAHLNYLKGLLAYGNTGVESSDSSPFVQFSVTLGNFKALDKTEEMRGTEKAFVIGLFNHSPLSADQKTEVRTIYPELGEIAAARALEAEAAAAVPKRSGSLLKLKNGMDSLSKVAKALIPTDVQSGRDEARRSPPPSPKSPMTPPPGDAPKPPLPVLQLQSPPAPKSPLCRAIPVETPPLPALSPKGSQAPKELPQTFDEKVAFFDGLKP